MQKLKFSYLVVEDIIEVCNAVKHRMNNFPNWHCIGLIAFFDEAHKLIIEQKPDLLFLDYSIRGGNSFDLIKVINNIQNYKPYIIFFTAFQNDQPEIPENALNKYHVNKYLVKPIFEKLTNNLHQYILEAEKWLCENQDSFIWIETIAKQKLQIFTKKIICITQSEQNSRHKIIRTSDNKEHEFKASWTVCEKIALDNYIDYCFTNARYTLINKKFITKIQKPYIWLNDMLKVEVTKEKWCQFVE
jgi:two-component system, LytTR family, response regulator